MQIKLNLNIFIFILIFLFTRQIEIYGILMLFAVIHELTHMLVGIVLGLKPKTFTIMPLGFSVGFRVDCLDYNKKVKKGTFLCIKKIMIALAGPMINFILAIFFLFVDTTFFGIDRQLVVYSNLLIGLFNCIPLYPLDGGRVVKNILHILLGKQEAEKWDHNISHMTICLLTAVVSIGILYIRNIALLLVLGYLWGLVIIEGKKYKNKIKIYETLEQTNLKEMLKIK